MVLPDEVFDRVNRSRSEVVDSVRVLGTNAKTRTWEVHERLGSKTCFRAS